jgi:hypothetical protein
MRIAAILAEWDKNTKRRPNKDFAIATICPALWSQNAAMRLEHDPEKVGTGFPKRSRSKQQAKAKW